MRKRFVLLAGAVALFGSATGALAGAYGEAQQVEEAPASPPAVAMEVEEEIDYARTGFYLGAGGLYAIELFDAVNGFDTIAGSYDADVANSSGFFVSAGYRLHPNIAVEARYENYLEFDTDPDGHYDGYSVMFNAKGYMLTGRFQPYAVVGLGYADIEGHDVPNESNQAGRGAGAGEGFAMRFGIGMDAYITEHISIGPEVAYMLPFEGAANFDMITISLGLNYRF